MSKNRPTIEHLKIACRHVEELMAAGVTENHAIRTLELLTDCYAKAHNGVSLAPHHVSQVPVSQWSKAARALYKRSPDAKPRDHLRVEHGTPRRHFARMVLNLHRDKKLSKINVNKLVKKHWMVAVITLDEDRRLNQALRSKLLKAPTARWAAAKIVF